MEAREFSSSTAYAKGDLCLYGGILYRFTSAHSAGAWTGSDAEAVDSSAERDLERIVTGYNRAAEDTVYAGKVKFEPALIAGTRYKYKLVDA